MFIKILFSYTL